MGWLQSVGSIRLYVSFAKETYKRDAILKKRPIILSILLTVATSYRIWLISHVGAYGICSISYDLYHTYAYGICSRQMSHSSADECVTHFYGDEFARWLIPVPTYLRHGSFLWRHNECIWLMRMCNMTSSYVWHYSLHVCDMMHSYVWHDTCVISAILVHVCDITHAHVRHESFICVVWLVRMCDMTHSCVWHDAFIRVTWLIHTCDMTHSYVRHDSFVCVTWRIHMCDMTHSNVWHDSFIMCDMTQSYVRHDSNSTPQRLRLVGSLKL